MAIRIDPEVGAILKRCTFGPNCVALPEQLDRATYLRVSKVLAAAGGKWSRASGVHVFDCDPRERLGIAIEDGKITSSKSDLGQFFTPDPWPTRMAILAKIAPGMRVLEPSAGHGALADACRARGSDPLCVDIDPKNVAVLKQKRYEVVEGDFLKTSLCDRLGFRSFDAVVMNPPFKRGIEIDHVLRARQMLKPDAMLVAILPTAAVYGGTSKHALLRSGIWITGKMPKGTFSATGTDVETSIVSMRGVTK